MSHTSAVAVSQAIWVPAQTLLLEPAMQHIGIHAMFTRRGGDRCAGLQARGDQFDLELWRIGAARARHRIARGLRIFEHRVHGCFVDAILLKELFSIKMGLPDAYAESTSAPGRTRKPDALGQTIPLNSTKHSC